MLKPQTPPEKETLTSEEPTRSAADMAPALPASWHAALGKEFEQPYYRDLRQFLVEERKQFRVFPDEGDVFNALKLTPLERVRVLIVGQDPYHDEDQAHGLCFSVKPGVKPPPSLKNIFRELLEDVRCPAPTGGDLSDWAEQGVLLLNSVLTVRAHEAGSHQKKGWEQFTDAVVRTVNAKNDPVAFLIWGAHARKKLSLIDRSRHLILESAHPSPLSARSGFFGSKPFSRINAFLTQKGLPPVDWCLRDNQGEK